MGRSCPNDQTALMFLAVGPSLQKRQLERAHVSHFSRHGAFPMPSPGREFEDPRLEKRETWGTLMGFSHFVLVAYCETQTWATCALSRRCPFDRNQRS